MNQEEENNIVAEFHAFGETHKAIVQHLENGKFTSIVYEWNENERDDCGVPLWEKVTGPFLLDTKTEAEENAQQNLEIFSFQIPDRATDKALIDFTSKTLGHDDFRFFVPDNFEVEYLANEADEKFETITPTKVLHTGDFCFVENEDQWISGILESKGKIKGWKSFDDLKSALKETMSP